MGVIKLGDQFAPKISNSNVSSLGSASINNDDPADFSTAGPDKRQGELNDRLFSSGQMDNFNTPFVGADDNARLDAMMLETSNVTPSAGEMPEGTLTTTNDLKVKITQDPAFGDGPNELVFKVMPRISEQGGAEYEPITPMQHPGAIQKFRNSTPRTWTVSGRLVSRTSAEASENLQIINMIRAWRMPFYGVGTANDSSTSAMLGAPPPILTLTAYGPSMIGPAKCVLTSYNWDFDNQLDYIPTEEGNPFPVILDISLSLTESWSPSEFSGFDLAKFKRGDLSADGAFRRVTASIPTTQSPDDISPNEPTRV